MKNPEPFGRYQLVEKIATGGMAEIFKAKLVGIEGFEKTLVIKRILPFWSERKDFVTMLVDEAKVLVHLNHPNIVQVYELGRVEDTYFIAMEYVEGVDLRHLIKKNQALKESLPQEVALAITMKSLEGLQYAHDRSVGDTGHLGIVHRDISPQNILLSFQGDVKVTDFGIAKAVTQSHETQTGVLKGKYAYMAPEQALGSSVDRRTDLFACGIVLYEMLFGQRPFQGKTDIEILDSVRRAAPAWPEGALKKLYPGLEEVLKKVLSPKSEDRYQSAEDFRDALDHCVPAGKRLSSSRLATYLKDLFKEEMAKKKAGSSESSGAGTGTATSGPRRTLVAAVSEDGTVSLVESEVGKKLKAETDSKKKLFASENLPSSKKRGLNLKKAYHPWIYGSLAVLLFLSVGFFALQKFVLKIPKPEENLVGLAPASSLLEIPVAEEVLKPLGPPKPNEEKLAQLKAQPDPILFSSFEIAVKPDKAKILASYKKDGKEQTLEGEGRLKIEALLKDTQIKVSAKLKGYKDFNNTYKIIEPGKVQVEGPVELKKISEYGTVRVRAFPWGDIFVGNFSLGRSNNTYRSRKIKAGSYAVRVKHPDWGSVSTRLRINPERNYSCSVDFTNQSGLSCR